MKDIDEAIRHCLDVAERNEMTCQAKPNANLSQYRECAEEHRQLAEWLKELKRHREAWQEVRAEIEKSAYPLDDLVGKSDMGYVIDLEDVLQIIDKALGEVEQ